MFRVFDEKGGMELSKSRVWKAGLVRLEHCVDTQQAVGDQLIQSVTASTVRL